MSYYILPYGSEVCRRFVVTTRYARKHLFLPQTKHRIKMLSGREVLRWAVHGKLLVVPLDGRNEKHREELSQPGG